MMSHLDPLPEPTKALWSKIRDEPLLKGGILIGGTALTLRIGHRRSEDLDFAFLSERLPSAAINLLLRKYPDWTRNDNLLSYEEFQIAGQSLHDYQQDFVSGDGVKITFLAEEKPVWAILDHKREQPGSLRVATTKEILDSSAWSAPNDPSHAMHTTFMFCLKNMDLRSRTWLRLLKKQTDPQTSTLLSADCAQVFLHLTTRAMRH